MGPGEAGRFTWRRRTASWWHRARISASLAEGVHPSDPEEFEGTSNEAIYEGQGHELAASPRTLDQVKIGSGNSWTLHSRMERLHPSGSLPGVGGRSLRCSCAWTAVEAWRANRADNRGA
jgi:hypothetical protein